MAEEITGATQLLRIQEYLTKALGSADLVDYHVLIDKEGDATSFKTPLSAILAFASGIYRPATQPVLSGSNMPINMIGSFQGMFEPRSTSGVRTIPSNFTIVFSNDSNADLISCVFSLTGTVTITLPSNVNCSNAGLIGTWNDGAKTLELAAGTDDLIELQFLKDKTSGNYLLKVSDPLIS